MIPHIENWKVGQTGKGVAKAGIDGRKTTPPKPYTEATLLADMKSAAKFIANEQLREALKEADGIGTPATRASIIERLKEVGSISVERNKIRSTPEGQAIVMGLPDLLTDPGTTALWEEMLAKIAQGLVPMEKFMKMIEGQVMNLVEEAEQTTIRFGKTSDREKGTAVPGKRVDAPCPRCGGLLSLEDRWLRCANGDFTMFREVFTVKLSDAQMLSLLKNKKVGPINGLVSPRTRKVFAAVLELQEDGRTQCKF